MTGFYSRIRILNIMDDCSREALAVHADFSIPSQEVIVQLENLEQQRELPKNIRVDNGPEFTSLEFAEWCKARDIEIKFIQPGRPMQNGYIE
ncbi:MAG: IS3 family transposase, partial [Candidatus Brocadia sp. WS118]